MHSSATTINGSEFQQRTSQRMAFVALHSPWRGDLPSREKDSSLSLCNSSFVPPIIHHPPKQRGASLLQASLHRHAKDLLRPIYRSSRFVRSIPSRFVNQAPFHRDVVSPVVNGTRKVTALHSTWRQIYERAFLGPNQMFPASRADFALLFILLAADQYLFRLMYSMYCNLVKLRIAAKSSEERAQIPANRLEPLPFDETILGRLEGSLRIMGFLFLISGVIKLLVSALIQTGIHLPQPYIVGQRVFVIGAFVYLARALSEIKSEVLRRDRAQGKIVNTPAKRAVFSKAMDVMIWILMATIAADVLGLPIKSLLTIGGFSGIAIGLATRSLVENIIAGISLMLQRRFSVGDMIRIVDKGIDGMVIALNWTTTKIRLPDTAVLTIPNSDMVNKVTINLSELTNRRMARTLRLRISDFNQVKNIVRDIRGIVTSCDEIEQSKKNPPLVFYTGSDEYVHKIEVTLYYKGSNQEDFLAFQEDLLFKMGDVIKEHGADFASMIITPL